VVQNILLPLKKIQNCDKDETLFNLKMMNKSLNITKGAAVKHWLEDRVVTASKSPTSTSGARFNHLDLQQAYRKSSAVKNGIIDPDEADTLADILQRQLIIVEETYMDRLAQTVEMAVKSNLVSDKRAHEERMNGLRSSIGDMLLEHEG
jgi:hypothetical protein